SARRAGHRRCRGRTAWRARSSGTRRTATSGSAASTGSVGGARSEGVAAAAAVWYGRVRSGAQTAGRHVASVPAVFVLVPLVLAQWAVTIVIARSATHSGWLYYHGGDGTYYWTTTWSLAHHRVPETIISYGLPVFYWPLGLIYGANILAGLP